MQPSTTQPGIGQRGALRDSVAPAARNASTLTAFAKQMGVQRRRSTAKMRAIQQADFALLAPCGRLLDHALGVSPGEHVVVLVDYVHRDLGVAFEVGIAERRATALRLTLDDLGALPLRACPAVVLAALSDAAVVISAVDSRSGEQDFHRELEQAVFRAGARHLSLGGVSREALMSSLSAPCERTFDGIDRMARLLRDASRVTVRSLAGTDLTIGLSRRSPPFTFGAPPRSGELLRAPFGRLEIGSSSIDGTYVADASAGELVMGRVAPNSAVADAARGGLSSRPLRVEVERSLITKIHGVEAAAVREISRFVGRGPSQPRVSRWVMGANAGCSSALGEVSHDVNRPGVHLLMGGDPMTDAPYLALAMSHADVDVDGQALFRAGRFVRW